MFRDIYGPLLLSGKAKLAVLFVYLLYASSAVYGLFQIKEGLDPKNLVRSSFYLTDFYVLIDETFWREGWRLKFKN